MKINPMNSVQNPYRKQIEKQEQVSELKEKRDKVEISNIAKELQQSSKIEQARQVKVNKLKEQIESGNYKVNPQEVAKKFYEYWTK